MKKHVCLLAAIALVVVVPSVFAAWTITEDWTVDYTTNDAKSGTYNPVTDHFLLGAHDSIPIYNASDGTPTGSSLTMPSGSGFWLFAMTCAEDGVIFAYDYGNNDLYRWADESATPETLSTTGDDRMGTIRCLRAYGSGNDTRIYVTGRGDNDIIQLITTDGSTWTVQDLINSPAAKSGVFAVPPAFTTVYGLQPWGSDYDPTNVDVNQQQGWPRRFDYSDTTWSVNTSFIPEDPNTENHTSYCVGGDYVPAEGSESAFIYVYYYNLGQLWALNADTGARIPELDYSIPGFTSYAMNVQVDTTNKKIYYANQRSATQGGSLIAESVFGRLSYSAAEPTPIGAAVEMDWQIYE